MGKEVWIKLSKYSRRKLGYIVDEDLDFFFVVIPLTKPKKKSEFVKLTHGVYKIDKKAFVDNGKNRVYLEYKRD